MPVKTFFATAARIRLVCTATVVRADLRMRMVFVGSGRMSPRPTAGSSQRVKSILGGTSSLGTGSTTVELYTYNLPHVIDLTALAVLAELVARVQTATGP